MKKHYYFAIVFVLPLLFCQHPNSTEPTPDIDEPGRFSLTQLQGLQKTATITADTNTIDLGDLHSTEDYYFLLTNCGGHVITNINLSVSDSFFTIFPTSIDSLTIGLGTQTLVPIIKLTALHGFGSQGWGSEPLMSQGIHQVHINITGVTKRNNIDTNTSLTAVATVNALVMDIDMHSISKTIDFTQPNYFGPSSLRFDNFPVVGVTGYATADSTDSIVTIINKGNVDIFIKTEVDLNRSDSATYIIYVGDSANFVIPPLSYGFLLFQIDGNNTICDPNKLFVQNNGKTYFYVGRN